jgi:hypothetical protein
MFISIKFDIEVEMFIFNNTNAHCLVDGQTETCWIPQIPFPSTAAMLIYPFSPHVAPQEFLTM